MIARGALLVLLVACGDEPARVRLVPISPCGQVENETAIRVVAFTAAGEQRRMVPPAELDAFPADTEQLGVEVIGDSGRIVAVGKTAPLAFASLQDAAEIPIVMAPVDGFCAVGGMTEPRHQPAVARAGDSVLVVGGTGAAGEQLGTAELYDPTTATFSAIPVPATLLDADNGLAGAVLTELPDGRVALTGTASHALAYFDPATRRFSTPSLFDRRAFHGAASVASDRLLVIGGCEDVGGGTCSGPPLTDAFIYNLGDLSMRERGPVLDAGASRLGATVVPLGVQSDGVSRYLFAGGFGEPSVADRFALTDVTAERIAGVHAQVAPLEGGGVLTAFAPDGAAPAGSAAVLPPDRVDVVPIAIAPALAGARLAQLEDGSVLAIGSGVARYQPTANTWTVDAPAGTPPGSLAGPSLIRLADGTLLVLGGAATADAWIYRPSLIGPSSGSVIVVPGGNGGGVLTPVDPSTIDRSGGNFVLTSGEDDLHARALVGGPRIAQGSVTAIVRITTGGVALIAQQRGPGEAFVGRLVPGEPARIVQLAAGTQTVLCSGAVVAEDELTAPVGFAISGGTATLSIGPVDAATIKVSCDVPATERGAWGIAAAGAGARVEVGPVTVARTR